MTDHLDHAGYTDELIDVIREKIDTDDPRFVALHDVLTELDQIIVEANHPDAVGHARAAVGRLALLWLTVDELDERAMTWMS